MMTFLSRIRRAVKREHAEVYVLLLLVSFAASVTGTRLFLELTGYPQLGNSELHIAHVLWGGLLLFVGALLPLVFANRWAYTLGALASGVGVGLFIDEIGKFITQSNDYFFPFAAPIIYAFFLLCVLVYVTVRRPNHDDTRAELYGALDGLMEVLDHDLDPGEQQALEVRLARIVQRADHPDHAKLAQALLAFVQSEALDLVPDKPTLVERTLAAIRAFEDRYLSRGRHRLILVLGLGAFGAWAALSLLVTLLALLDPVILETVAVELLNREALVAGTRSLTWYLVMMALEGAIGALLVLAAWWLRGSHETTGLRLGTFGLLIALTMVNLLVFYFDQFATITLSVAQFLLLVGLLRYRRRFLAAR